MEVGVEMMPYVQVSSLLNTLSYNKSKLLAMEFIHVRMYPRIIAM